MSSIATLLLPSLEKVQTTVADILSDYGSEPKLQQLLEQLGSLQEEARAALGINAQLTKREEELSGMIESLEAALREKAEMLTRLNLIQEKRPAGFTEETDQVLRVFWRGNYTEYEVSERAGLGRPEIRHQCKLLHSMRYIIPISYEPTIFELTLTGSTYARSLETVCRVEV